MRGSLIRTPRRCGGIHAQNDDIRNLLVNIGSFDDFMMNDDSSQQMIEETCGKSVKIDVSGGGSSGGTRGGVFIGIAENDDDVYTCMKCQKDDVREMDGNIFCNSCGIFICHKLTCNAEFHTYFNDDKSADQTRCGLPTNSLIPESSLGTIMLTRGGTGGRRTGGAAGAMEMQRLRRTHNYNQMTPRDRNRYRRMERIKLIGKHMNLADIIIHDAQHYYTRLVAKREVLRGTNKQGIIAACVYYSCKKHACPRSVKEITEMFEISQSVLTLGCKKFERIMFQYDMTESYESNRASDFIDRFCCDLKIGDENIISLIKLVGERADAIGLGNESHPPCIAISIIKIIMDIAESPIANKDLIEVCKLSEGTVERCIRMVTAFRKYILPLQLLTEDEIQSLDNTTTPNTDQITLIAANAAPIEDDI